tara:strand:+ start:2839 stop:3783 length:945 start_codon:yes stop_codon:yes gene_type:complete
MNEFKISNKNWNKIQNYSRYAWDEHESEIGGFMTVHKRPDGNFEISEPVILEQEITAGNTIITKNALASYYNKTAMKHGTDNLHYCWWHSHHTMAAFWSGTDLTAIDLERNDDWSCALVVNLRGEYKFRVNHWQPIEAFKDIDIEIEGVKEKKVPKAIIKEVEELCTKPIPIVPTIAQWPVKNVGFWNGGGETTAYNNSFMRMNDQRQLNVFADDKDHEITQLEAKYDNILTDYITDDDFDRLKAKVKSLNNSLEKNNSQLRIGEVTSQSMLDTIINVVDVDSYIYRVGSEWDLMNVFDKYGDLLNSMPGGSKL